MDEKNFVWSFDIAKLKEKVDQGRIETIVRTFYDGEITDFDWGVAFDILFTIFGNDAFETTDLTELENSIALSMVTRKRKDLRHKSALELIDMVLFNNELSRMGTEFMDQAKEAEQRVISELNAKYKIDKKTTLAEQMNDKSE